MNIHLLGATSTTGIAFRNLIKLHLDKYKIFLYSSKAKNYNSLNLKNFDEPNLLNKESASIVVSFAPIWFLSEYLEKVNKINPEIFSNVKGLIVCSSSSSVTKRFSSNNFDKKLSKLISNSEEKILSFSCALNIKSIIIQPSLIYGSTENLRDKNISRIVKLIKIFPLVFLPNKSGLRQPIHISQLAKVFFHFTGEIANQNNSFNAYNNTKLLVGGDEEISYAKMIDRLIKYLNKKNKIFFCKIISIPDRVFLFIFSPLMLFSPKIFDAIQRLSANLSGFIKANYITKDKIQKFPIEPF